MTPERWQTVKELAAAASELAPGQRQAYLAQACGEDAGLRAEVDSLLEAAEQAPGLVDRPAIESLIPELCGQTEQSLIGKQVGAFQIVRLIAEGGMGSVYLGARADQEYRQEVAIKIIRGSLLDGESYRRFCQERQTLANLNHAYIARLLDGGRSDDGLPFLVMEYVAGQPIDAYCSTHRLDLPARLRLFREVCAAVQYAHQNLIVHRDLKPSNILVTLEGSPKLLDFGIAKVLDSGEAAPAAQRALTIQRCLTPEYASPEQFRGGIITTASDVYSLGVLLYELLTGRRPFSTRSGLMPEWARTICEEEPERPSTAARRSARKSAAHEQKDLQAVPETGGAARNGRAKKPWRHLAGDLDAIVLMAMRKEPERRYVSVEQFSDDIRRHLEGLPIRARQGTWRYRSAKFARRHRAAVVAAGVMVVSLLGGSIMSVRSAGVANRERDTAVAARRVAQQEAENARVEARKSERVTSFLQKMLSAANPSRDGPDVSVGQLLDEAATRVVDEFGDDPEIESAVRSAIGDAYVGLGRYPEAELQLQTALAIQRRIHGGDHADVASSLNALGVLLHAKGDYAGAQECFVQALAMRERLFGREHSDVAQNLNNLAVVLRLQGDDVQAESLLRQALAIRRRLYGDEHLVIAETLNNLANVLLNRRDYAAAEPLCREVLSIRRKLLADEHPQVAQAIHNLGVLLSKEGRYAEAEPLLRRSIILYRKQLGSDHPELAGGLFNLGELLFRAGDAGSAEPFFRECLAIRRRSLPERDARTIKALQSLGNCLVSLNRCADAEPLLIEGYQALAGTAGPGQAATQAGLQALVDLYETWDRPDEAAHYRQLAAGQTTTSAPADD